VTLTSGEIGGFTDSQVALLQTFAEQAVIAITSAETYRELQQRTGDLQESLEYQTATSDVLKVISRSTFDLQLVLDTLVETAMRLCEADHGNIFRREGEGYRRVSSVGLISEMRQFVEERPAVHLVNRGSLVGRVALEGGIVHIHDVAADPEFMIESAFRLGKLRTSP
jgi:two-component system NtrC family sensor kinase